MSGRQIPGYVFDPEKGRYFAITNGESRFNSKYSNSAVQADDRQKRNSERKSKKPKGKADHLHSVNEFLKNVYHAHENMIVSSKLGLIKFSYLPMLVALFQMKPKKLPDYVLWPMPYYDSAGGICSPIDPARVLFHNKSDLSVGIAEFPVGEKAMSVRAVSREVRDVSYVSNETGNYVFFIEGPYSVRMVDSKDRSKSISIDILEEIGLIDHADTPDPDEGSGTEFSPKTSFTCIAPHKDQVYLFTRQSCLAIDIQSVSSPTEGERVSLPKYQGNILDVIMDDNLISYFRYKEICLTEDGMFATWVLKTPIRRHFRYSSPARDQRNGLHVIAITKTHVHIRSFSRDDFCWRGEIIAIPLQEHNNGAPISCLHRGVLIVEEDRGHFLAIDLEAKRYERFVAPEFAFIERHGSMRTIFSHYGSMYLSSDSQSHVFG